jgi:flavodoxin
MHIGIVYFSHTGFTEEFVNRIANGLIKERYHVEIIRLKTNIEVTGPFQGFKILEEPDCSKFDYVLFGGPVWAFSICPVVIEGIKISKGLSGKDVILFVTMGFPFKFMGGTRAINQMSEQVRKMGANVVSQIIIPRLFHDSNALMDKAINEIKGLLKVT